MFVVSPNYFSDPTGRGPQAWRTDTSTINCLCKGHKLDYEPSIETLMQ